MSKDKKTKRNRTDILREIEDRYGRDEDLRVSYVPKARIREDKKKPRSIYLENNSKTVH